MSAPIWMLTRMTLKPEQIARLVSEKAEEHQRLDFKREVGTDFDELRKDVVGMLNGGGGLILVGVADVGNRADSFVPVPNATAEASRLEQAIYACVEPYALGLDVFPVDVPGHGSVIAIHCPASSRRPFARTSRNRCAFFQRKGQHVLDLSLEEVRGAFREGEQLLVASDRDWDDVVAATKRKHTGPALVVQLRPVLSSAEIVDPLDERVRALLARPEKGQPHPSWAETLRAGREGDPTPNRVTIALHGLRVESSFDTRVGPRPGATAPRFEVEVRRTGALTFSTAMLHARDWHYSNPPEHALSPISLVWLPVSLAAVARDLFETLAIPGPFDVRVALISVGACKLTTFVPQMARSTPLSPQPEWHGHSEGQDILIPRMTVAALDAAEHPFFRPLERLFQAFGWDGPPAGVFLADGSLDPNMTKST